MKCLTGVALNDLELVCGCSLRGPCPTAAPFFKYRRMRKLRFHLEQSYAWTIRERPPAEEPKP